MLLQKRCGGCLTLEEQGIDDGLYNSAGGPQIVGRDPNLGRETFHFESRNN